MWKRIALILGFIALCCGTAPAQKPYTPAVGSAERKSILDVLRVPFEREFKQKVKFDVSFFKVLNDWAFVLGAPENAQTGKKLRASPDIDPDFCGLLRKNARGEWAVISHASGFGDPTYADWPKKYGAPLRVFPEVIWNMQN